MLIIDNEMASRYLTRYHPVAGDQFDEPSNSNKRRSGVRRDAVEMTV